MVAETIALPNIRKFFIPDPGFTIADCDLSGADAQVVAAEARDERLLAAFASGASVHVMNVRDCFPDKVKGWSDEAIKDTNHPNGIYYNNKRGVHGTNYGGKPMAIAAATGWTVKEAEAFQRNWFGAHPGILEWHLRTERWLTGEQCWNCDSFRIDSFRCLDCGKNVGRTVRNRFGFRIVYFDRVDGLLPEALAWVPQSTVALVTNTAALRIYKQVPFVEILLQVHDSLVFQLRYAMEHRMPEVLELMKVPIPYDPPLIIPWGHKTSRVSWGDCK